MCSAAKERNSRRKGVWENRRSGVVLASEFYTEDMLTTSGKTGLISGVTSRPGMRQLSRRQALGLIVPVVALPPSFNLRSSVMCLLQ